MALGSNEFFQILFVLFNITFVAVSNRLFAGIVEIIIKISAVLHADLRPVLLLKVPNCRICSVKAGGKKDSHRCSARAKGRQILKIKTLSAGLNVAINNVASFCNIMIMLPLIIRSLFGQLT